MYDTLREALAAVAAKSTATRPAVIYSDSDGRLFTPGGYREHLERYDPALLASPVLLAWGDYADPRRGCVWAYVWPWGEGRTWYGTSGSGDEPICTVEAIHPAEGERSI